eukprot:TRINITY_DN928_c0_g1_i2.p1 TRINITY_DN928_c0_g1~~TRINITY_DN928_c0_g1_i2.p1  ORF type:complete len:408 (-),score=50.59 TRINITY_DN928_c0_g1_i2:168-1391(-)
MWRSHMMDHVKKEIHSLRSISHPHVVSLHEVFYSPDGHNLFLILDLCRGGDIYDLIVPAPGSDQVGGPLAECSARRYFQQMMSGIAHCHGHGISHRDIKPENLLLDSDGTLRISDFGLSTFTASAPTSTKCGTAHYLAPEVTVSLPYDAMQADIWSSGVLLYVLITACLPFEHENEGELYKLIQSALFEWPENVKVSEGARDLVSRMLQPDPTERITTAQVLVHPWVLIDLDESLFAEEDIQIDLPVVSPDKLNENFELDTPPLLPVNAFELLNHIGSIHLEGLCDSHPCATHQFISISEPRDLSRAISEFANSHGFVGHRGDLALCLAGKVHGAPLQFEVEMMLISQGLVLTKMSQTCGSERLFQKFYDTLYASIGPDHVRDYKKSSRSLTPNRTHFADPGTVLVS